jgi:predicted MPP superfamily phosphohydrolase
MIETTAHSVIVPHLPSTLQGLRVAHLTDFHRSRHTSDLLLRRAVVAANAARPDLILLTGDYVTRDPRDIAPCAHILAPLQARLGVYAILGNHDYTTDGPAMERSLTELGFHVLLNRSVLLPNGLRIVGLDDDRHHRTDVPKAFREVGPNEPTLVMAHNPALIERMADRECLVFSGHTHGGQIRVPVLTEREIRRIGAKHYARGWYSVGKARLYVNRGLGRVGIPLRLFCRPELALFTLTTSPAPPT